MAELKRLETGIAADSLLIDIGLPRANGLAVAYRERFPDLPVVYVTGYAEQMQPVLGIIISKLYRIDQVIGVLGTALA